MFLRPQNTPLLRYLYAKTRDKKREVHNTSAPYQYSFSVQDKKCIDVRSRISCTIMPHPHTIHGEKSNCWSPNWYFGKLSSIYDSIHNTRPYSISMSILLSFSLQKINYVQGTKRTGTSEGSREFKRSMSVLLLQRRNFFVFTQMYRYCTKESSLKLILGWHFGPQSDVRHRTASYLWSHVAKISDVGIMLKTKSKVNALHYKRTMQNFCLRDVQRHARNKHAVRAVSVLLPETGS